MKFAMFAMKARYLIKINVNQTVRTLNISINQTVNVMIAIKAVLYVMGRITMDALYV